MSSGMTYNPDGLVKGLSQLGDKQRYAMLLYGKSWGIKMQTYAKQNRPWIDRSHMAKKSIRGTAEAHDGGDRVRIRLYGGVKYMVYLELARKKKYAILWPTIEKFRDAVVRGIPHIDKR